MQLGGSVEGGRSPRIRPCRGRSHRAECALLDGLKDHAGSPPRLDVWMSHGDRVTAMPRGLHASPRAPIACRSSPWPTRRGAGTACSSIRKSPTPSRAKRMLRRFVVDICGCAHAVDRGQHHRRPDRARARAGRRRRRAARPVRRRRFVGGRGAAAPGHRRPADLRVRRHRPAALAGRRPGDGDVRRAHGRQGDPRRMRPTAISARWPASPIRKPSARSSATCSSRSSTRNRPSSAT